MNKERRYKELDRVQAELQIMWYLGAAPLLLHQLIEYAEDVAALLRREGVWAVTTSDIVQSFTPYERVVYVERDDVNFTAIVLCISCACIKSRDLHRGWSEEYYHHNNMLGLVIHMRGWPRRKVLREATLQRCGTCLYSDSGDNPRYCGAGLTFDVGCTSYEVRAYG